MVSKELILKSARINDGSEASNIKLGSMGSWAMLFGNIKWNIPELGMSVNGTCGNHCSGCFSSDNPKKSACYVSKSYTKYTKRNEDGSIGNIVSNQCSVKLGHAYRTIAMTMYRDDLFKSLNSQMTRKKKKFEVVRINESGELTCYQDLEMWCKLASTHPETIFYLYTKNYDVVFAAVENDIIPNNLFVNISIWHSNGIEQYLKLKEHKQIRAFVFVDKEWTVDRYRKAGLDIHSMCGAYDADGRMNHSLTCAKCKKCFSCRGKCVGCYEH